MPDRHVDHLLIGGGIAAATCAATLRSEGASGSILVAGRELDPPYHRPPASKGYLLGRESKADALIHPEGWWEEQGVELATRASVMALDPQARVAKVGKEQVSYGTALLATGAMVRRLSVEGSDLDGIHYLRALANADAIRSDVEAAERVVCIGGSYIGCEVAASLTVLGKRVTIVMQEEEPLSRGFGVTAGRRIRAVLEEHGIEVVGGADVAEFEGTERISGVRLADGRLVQAGAVVCGVGAMPDVMLARKSGLPIGERGGVRCDATLAVTGCAGLFAAGDMCEFDSVVHGEVVRIEHEEVAAAQGATAARNMLGAGVAHDVVPYFWSDLADWLSLEYVGPAATWDDEVAVEADTGWGVWYLLDGRVVAALSVGGALDLDVARERLRSRERMRSGSL